MAQLASQATSQGLHQSRQWRVLLHYRPVSGGQWESEIDGPRFFLSPEGKHSPEKELQATILAYDQPPGPDRRIPAPACRFMARYHWLRSHFGEAAFPPKSCPFYESWSEALDLGAVSLVFPAYDLYKPGSMFGHTLLRFKKQTGPGNRLFDFSASFGADVDDNREPAASLIVNGLLGGFTGSFYVTPFYKRIAEYSEVDVRDLWEYELDLRPEELDALQRHLFEISFTYMDYFFFDENCSYHLLGLIEAARPSLRLKEEFPLWATPTDSLRLVIAQVGTRGPPSYYPSRLSRLQARRQRLDEVERHLYLEALQTPATLQAEAFKQRPGPSQARILDALIDASALSLEPEMRARKAGYLVQRSKLAGVISPEIHQPQSTAPELGHHTSRAGLSGGQAEGEAVQEVELRLSFHDLLDRPTGYSPYSRIDFGRFALRRRGEETRLQRAILIEASSLLPWDEVNRGWNWQIKLGWEQEPGLDSAQPPWQMAGGLGASFLWGPLHSYHLAYLRLLAHPSLEQGARGELGLRNGLIARYGDLATLLLEQTHRPARTAASGALNHWSLQWGLHPGPAWMLALSAKVQDEQKEALASFYWYF